MEMKPQEGTMETIDSKEITMRFEKGSDEIEKNMWAIKANLNNIAKELGENHPDVLEMRTTLNNMVQTFKTAREREETAHMN